VVEWLIAAAVFGLLVLAMIFALPHLKPRKGAGGLGVALLMIFASVFDQAKAPRSNSLGRTDIEGSEEGESGARLE
jgi:hypothetical protein